MDKKSVIEIVQSVGSVGCTGAERYIDYPDEIDGDWVQIVYFDDERGLAVYLVDTDGYNGEFVDYDDYSHREEIERYLETLSN